MPRIIQYSDAASVISYKVVPTQPHLGTFQLQPVSRRQFFFVGHLRSLSQHRFDGMEPLVLSFKKTLEAQQLSLEWFSGSNMCQIIPKSEVGFWMVLTCFNRFWSLESVIAVGKCRSSSSSDTISWTLGF